MKASPAKRSGPSGLYAPPADRAEVVDVPRMDFLMIDGRGDPNTSAAFAEAVEALYGLAYTVKFGLKKKEGIEFRVGPLEGLWWSNDMAEFSLERKGDWQWTLMIAQPEAVTRAHFEAALEEVKQKKKLPSLARVRLESFEEGLAAQILHVGPFSTEGPTIERLHRFIQEQGGSFDGRSQKHHEVYLSDTRRVAAEKWRTVIRQPFARA